MLSSFTWHYFKLGIYTLHYYLVLRTTNINFAIVVTILCSYLFGGGPRYNKSRIKQSRVSIMYLPADRSAIRISWKYRFETAQLGQQSVGNITRWLVIRWPWYPRSSWFHKDPWFNINQAICRPFVWADCLDFQKHTNMYTRGEHQTLASHLIPQFNSLRY